MSNATEALTLRLFQWDLPPSPAGVEMHLVSKCWASGSTVLLGTADGSDLLGLSPSASGTHTHKTSFFIPVTVWFCFLLFFLTVTQSNRVKSMSAFESRAS